MNQAQRHELATRLFHEGLDQIERLQLIRFCPDLFHYTAKIKTGWTDGAGGYCPANAAPFIYIGLRLGDFDKATALRRAIENPGKGKVWKLETQHAKLGEWLYVEYSHIHNDDEIGGFISDDPKDHVRATVAHELAHTVHWWNIHMEQETDKVNHGGAWQTIYRALRVGWVNPARLKDRCSNCGVGEPKHRFGVGSELCCRCHVQAGHAPANWHSGCMEAYAEINN